MQDEAATLYFFAIRTGQLTPKCCSAQAPEHTSFHGLAPLDAIEFERWSYTPQHKSPVTRYHRR